MPVGSGVAEEEGRPDPVPSSPSPLLPQHQTVPSVLSAHVKSWSGLFATCATPVKIALLCKSAVQVDPHLTEPSIRTAQSCPTRASDLAVSPETRAAVLPQVLQQATVLSLRMAHEMSPAAMEIASPGMPGTPMGLVPQHCT